VHLGRTCGKENEITGSLLAAATTKKFDIVKAKIAEFLFFSLFVYPKCHETAAAVAVVSRFVGHSK
jgi:hypothetical protein